MDFKSFLSDKAGYNAILVVVDRLSKRPILVAYRDTATAKDLVQMFVEYV